jgi:signal transduction histidine kinase
MTPLADDDPTGSCGDGPGDRRPRGLAPTDVLGDLSRRYTAALREYLADGSEAALLSAYELGRAALTEGVDVLDMAGVHQGALVESLVERLAPARSAPLANRAAEFFAGALAPYEMSRRAFEESNAILRDLNRELEHRVLAVLQDFQASQEQLEEQRRLDRLKNEFISTVSHELRTPLTSIHGSLGLIASGMGGELSPRARQLLEVANRNCQRLVRLVNDVLNLQRIESGAARFDPRPLEIASLLEQATEANQSYGSRFGVSFVLEDAPRGALVRADADGLMQVMANLLSNAAKFSPANGTVLVSAERRGRYIRVRVTDRGPGVPEEFRCRIFEMFAQGGALEGRDREGSGLGLSITKAILDRLGGRIGFDSDAGAGTTFYFDLAEYHEAGAGADSEASWDDGR